MFNQAVAACLEEMYTTMQAGIVIRHKTPA